MNAGSLVLMWLWCFFDGVSVAHPTDILVRLEESDTVLDHGSPRLAYPIVPHNKNVATIRV